MKSPTTLIIMLCIAAAFMLPLALGNSWVRNAPSLLLKSARAGLGICIIGLVFFSLCLYIFSSNNQVGPIRGQTEETVQGPNLPLAPTGESFFLNPPFENLNKALLKAKERGRPVFAVIYDSERHEMSRLSYTLGYFLEYATTKKLVDECFVPALLPVSQAGVRRLIPADDPLEKCRLIVIRSDGYILHSEGIPANPDEGLDHVRSIINKWNLGKGTE